MMTFTNIILIMALLNLTKNTNPVKASMTVLMLATVILYMMNSASGSTWMPLIFYLLFMGGILMMFMILSSLSPNELSMKMKVSYFTFMVILLTMKPLNSTISDASVLNIKNFTSNNQIMILMSLMILIYFISFLKILATKKISMRSNICHKKNNLVTCY